MRSTLLFAVLGLVCGLAVTTLWTGSSSPSRAGTALALSLEDVFDRADLVVEGEVIGRSAGVTPTGSIYTDWTIASHKTHWGAHAPERTIRLPGGVLPSGRGMVIPGMPRLTVGEEVLLFVGAASGEGLRMTVGLAQGKYRIVTGPAGMRAAVRATDHLTTLAGEGASRGARPTVFDYADLSARLEAARARRECRTFEAEETGR